MDLIALAIPFFLLALIGEMLLDRVRGTGYYRANDAINSLSAGTLSTTLGYFTKIVPATIWALVLQNFALVEVDPALFDLSVRGLGCWLLALLAFDFCYYWFHRCSHEISLLWAAHAVHHQSEDYNLSTALRQSSTGFLFGWIFYLPLFVLGMPLEVFVTVNALDLIYQFWVHTQHVRRLGWLEKVLVTPANHRVHHAQNEIYIDRNYGGILILWDRLFGSYQDELAEEPVVFGVRKPLQSWNPFWANLQVYDYLLFDATRTRRWRDKLKVWIGRTGWRPDDVQARFPKQRADLSRFAKYNPAVPRAAQWYVVAQFVAMVPLVFLIGELYSRNGALTVLLPCLLLWLTLFSIGTLHANPVAGRTFEWLRVLVLVPAGVLFAWFTDALPAQSVPLMLTVGAYTALSSIALWFTVGAGVQPRAA